MEIFCKFSSVFLLHHFESTGDLCNLIGSQQCDLFTNRTIFCSKSHHFFFANQNENEIILTNHISWLNCTSQSDCRKIEVILGGNFAISVAQIPPFPDKNG